MQSNGPLFLFLQSTFDGNSIKLYKDKRTFILKNILYIRLYLQMLVSISRILIRL